MFDVITNNRIQDFITLFMSIIVEAFPFIIIGVLVSIAIGLWFKEEWVLKIMPKNRFLSHSLIAFFGILMPVCECGNIPVARRLMMKGFSPSQSITFLLAAPIINPITFWATWEAFNYDHSIAVIRMAGAFGIAVFIGLLFSLKKNSEELITEQFNEVCHHEHDHHPKSKLREGLKIFRSEFIAVMRMLIIGAFIAALSQAFIPREIIMSIGQNPLLSILAMLIMAFVISICSNVDAFFALAYASTFTTGSLLTFMIFGPMIDIKILTMLKGTFKASTLAMITLLVALFSVLIGLAVNIL